jgi:recombination protein RecR
MRGFQNLPSIEALIRELNRLPGIGPKSATALAYHLVGMSPERIKRLAETISALPDRIHHCSICGNLAEQDPCGVCADPARDRSLLCVVENPLDVLSVERTGAYPGLYHVLGGVLSPLDGIGPAQLRIRELLERLKPGEIKEIILATNPSVEGEATAGYLQETIGGLNLGLSMTRFARGLPIGGDLVYADAETLAVAIQSRKAVETPTG